MLTIYGVYRSRASRIYWMAKELELAFRSVPVIQARRLDDPQAAAAPLNTQSPAFLAINPMGQIPCIDDDGLVLAESLAITLYLARKYPGPLSGQTLAEEATITAWTMFAASTLEPQTVKIVLVHDDYMENTEPGQAIIAVAARLLRRPFAMLEAHLETSPYLAGDRFTVADLNLAEVLRYAETQKALFDQHPRVSAWLQGCQARPAFKAMMAERATEPA